MSSTLQKSMLLGEIVTADFRTAEVFKQAGIDFCCGGKKSLEEACNELSLNVDRIIEQMEYAISTEPIVGQYFNDWNLDFLSDYIVNTHHKYVLKTLPILSAYTKKIAQVHGTNHPELIEIANLFEQVEIELHQHLEKEEQVLFPAIKRELAHHTADDQSLIRSEIKRMEGEHDFAGSVMDRIRVMTNGYLVPADGCETYSVCMRILSSFEDDLHVHVHLENNILYPKAKKI